MANTHQILVVEDDRETRDLIARYLEGRGFRVATAKNGAEMFERLENGAFSLLLLDLMLPGQDGLSLCRQLRAGKSPIPNQRIANGAQAKGDIGLRNCIKGLITR